jgi:hypothetical protein
MYANVYLDPKQYKLGIAVYAYGKVPGFSRMVKSPEEQEAIGLALEETFGVKDVDTSKAFNIFRNLALDDNKPMKDVELQRGNLFSYEKFKDKLETLGAFGKYFQNKAGVSVDLDDPMMWFNLEKANATSSEAAILDELSPEAKTAKGERLRQQNLKSLENPNNTPEQLEEALRRLYILISRARHFGTGPKDYSTSNPDLSPPSPPTFLVSKEFDFVFYPGYRGGISMTRLPTDKKMIHPISKPSEGEKDSESEKKWASTLVPDIREYLQATLENPSGKLIMELDYITEATAQTFYNSINVLEPSRAAFEKALIPTKAKAISLLSKLNSIFSSKTKVASSTIETWIDLTTGQMFKSEEQLLASLRSSAFVPSQEKLPLAARSLRRIASILIRHKRLRSIFDLMKE